MNVERRATRRSTAENRIVSDEKNGTTPEKPLPPPPAEKENSSGRKRSISSTAGKEKNGDVVVVLPVVALIPPTAAADEETTVVVEEEEEDGIPEPEAKVAKLSTTEELDGRDENDDEEEEEEDGGSSSVDSPAPASVTAVIKPRRKEKVTHPCPHCEKKFLKKTFLTKHLKFHSAPRPFVCDVEECERTFVKAADLTKHIKVAHEGAGEEFSALHSCPFCSKGFITRAEMDTHAETHVHEHKMYACRYCGKTFVKRFQMKIAVQAAQSETPDPCPYCKKPINPKAYSDN